MTRPQMCGLSRVSHFGTGLINGRTYVTNIRDRVLRIGGMALPPVLVLPATPGTTRWQDNRRPQPACKTAPINSLWPTTTARDCPADLPEQRTVGQPQCRRFLIAFRPGDR